VVDLPSSDSYSGHCRGGAGFDLDGTDVEAAGSGGGAREQALHGVGQPPSDARGPGDGQWGSAPGELAVKDEERQAAEVIAVEMGDEYRSYLAGVEPEVLEGAERGSAAVQEDWGEAVAGLKMDACLVSAAAAEGITATSECQCQFAILCCWHGCHSHSWVANSLLAGRAFSWRQPEALI
jgi:hypothetical protein